jgi:hypothetical protein
MVQESRDSTRHNTLVGLNGETRYVLLTDHFSGRIFGRAFATKAPPVDWINSWLASNSPQCPDKYVRMDGGGELGKCGDIHRTFANFGYAVELTGPDSSHQNGPGERPHQTTGDALCNMLSGANLQPNFWPYAFYHYIRLFNFVPHGDRPSSPFEMCGAPLPNLAKLRTFGCRIHVRPTTARYGRVVPNSRLGIFLGYSRSLKVMYYFDLGSSTVKTATHARFDEGMNDLDKPPPNVKHLQNLTDDGVVNPDRMDLPLLNLEVSNNPFDRLDELSPPSAASTHASASISRNATSGNAVLFLESSPTQLPLGYEMFVANISAPSLCPSTMLQCLLRRPSWMLFAPLQRPTIRLSRSSSLPIATFQLPIVISINRCI